MRTLSLSGLVAAALLLLAGCSSSHFKPAQVQGPPAMVWKAELPLSETDLVRQVATWLVPGHLVVAGQLQTESDGVHSRTLQAATIDLKTGALRTVDLAGNAASR